MRAKISLVPPGGNGTTIRIGRLGNFSAASAAIPIIAVATDNASKKPMAADFIGQVILLVHSRCDHAELPIGDQGPRMQAHTVNLERGRTLTFEDSKERRQSLEQRRE